MAEDCSVEGDHKAEGGRRSAEAMVSKSRGYTPSSRKVENGCGDMKKVDDQLPETSKNDNQLYKMITWLKN